MVDPIAFVSEHSETLVDFDIDYAELARRAGVPRYLRIPTVGTEPGFIAGLEGVVQSSSRSTKVLPKSAGGGATMPARVQRLSRGIGLSFPRKALFMSWLLRPFLPRCENPPRLRSVQAWMAGMLLLCPRLYVYHCQVPAGTDEARRFETMEARLIGVIMRPAMIAVWVFGLTLFAIDHGWLSDS